VVLDDQPRAIATLVNEGKAGGQRHERAIPVRVQCVVTRVHGDVTE